MRIMRALPLPTPTGSPLPSRVSAAKPVYLASDAHLGATRPAHASAFHEWLEFAAAEASEILLNGDVFDFWFEYRWGHTRGHDRTLRLLRDSDERLPMQTFGYSIIYLMVLFVFLLADHYLQILLT